MSLTRISHIDIAPELRLVGALLADAIQAANRGCPEARRWIDRCAAGYLVQLAPADVDPDELVRRYVAQVDRSRSAVEQLQIGGLR